MNKIRVLGFDLSKSTGISNFLVDKDEEEIKLEETLNIVSDPKSLFSRMPFFGQHYLIVELNKYIDGVFEKSRIDDIPITVAIEMPLFFYSAHATHGLYLIYSGLMLKCYDLGLNVVGYANSFIKKFAKLFTPEDFKVKGALKKHHIKRIYDKHLYPNNKDMFHEPIGWLDDVYDAVFIGLCGAHFQKEVEFMSYLSSENTTEFFTNLDSFFVGDDAYQRRFSSSMLYNHRFDCLDYGCDADTRDGRIEVLRGSLSKSKFLSAKSRSFFPYRIIQLFQMCMHKAILDKNNSLSIYEDILKNSMIRQKEYARIVEYCDPKNNFKPYLNRDGKYFFAK